MRASKQKQQAIWTFQHQYLTRVICQLDTEKVTQLEKQHYIELGDAITELGGMAQVRQALVCMTRHQYQIQQQIHNNLNSSNRSNSWKT
jgi:hypothetical protein